MCMHIQKNTCTYGLHGFCPILHGAVRRLHTQAAQLDDAGLQYLGATRALLDAQQMPGLTLDIKHCHVDSVMKHSRGLLTCFILMIVTHKGDTYQPNLAADCREPLRWGCICQCHATGDWRLRLWCGKLKFGNAGIGNGRWGISETYPTGFGIFWWGYHPSLNLGFQFSSLTLMGIVARITMNK